MLKFLFKIFGNRESAYTANPESSKVKNILIVRQHNQLGDMLCSVPLFAAIRKKFPQAHITLVASPINYEILFSDINPYIDKVITYKKTPLKNLLEFYKELKNHDYQIGIVPSTVSISRTSHFINFFSGAKIRVGVRSIDGKQNSVEYLLNVKNDFYWDSKRLHQTERNLDVGRQIGCDLSPGEKSEVRIHLSEDEINFAKSFIKENCPDREKLIITFHPGAGKQANRWSKDNFINVMKLMYEKFGCCILITSGSIDTHVTHSIKSSLDKLGINCKLIEDTPIRKVGAIIKQTDLYITNDTGTMHVAGGVDANVIALFGPTHGYEWAPSGENKVYIQSATNDINEISIETVYEKACSMLEVIAASKKKIYSDIDHSS